jgi:hypothetical protein
MRVSDFSTPFIACLVATPICLFLALLSAGAGHGDYLWAKILFPYTMLLTVIFESVTTPGIILAIVQYPLYGVALGLANRKHKVVHMAIALIVFHVLAAILFFLLPSRNFS